MSNEKGDIEEPEVSAVHQHQLPSIEDARAAIAEEHSYGFWQAMKVYAPAVGWSVIFSTTLIMEGYDTALLSSFYAYPSWLKKYGKLKKNGKYTISAAWQSGLSNGGSVGSILGLLISAPISERIGYRKTMLINLAFMTAIIFIAFFGPNVQTLQVSQILNGISWGLFQTLASSYAAEICPTVLRVYLTTWINICWVIGQFIASGVLRGLLSNTTALSYKIPYAIQWAFPPLIFVGVAFAPESPWWLVRKGRLDDARKVLKGVTTKAHVNYNPDHYIAMMVHTDEQEKLVSAGTSWIDCFRGSDLKRTEIAAVSFGAQALCGSAIMGYSAFFLEAAGLPSTIAFDIKLGQSGIAFMGTIVAWLFLPRFGRRTLYLAGLVGMMANLLIIGCLGIKTKKSQEYGIAALLLILTATFQTTIGPMGYSYSAEIGSTRLRFKTFAVGRSMYDICGIIKAILTPYMLNVTAWNWGAKSAFFWLGVDVFIFVWAYFRLPETRNRTFHELDTLFDQGVSARKFSTTYVDPFSDDPIVVEKEAQLE